MNLSPTRLCDQIICLVTVYETWSPALGRLRRLGASWVECLAPSGMTAGQGVEPGPEGAAN